MIYKGIALGVLGVAFGLPAMAQTDSDTLSMERIIHSLPDVLVKGERPLARVKNGVLAFDLRRMIRNRGVDNAYEALKQLPGVAERSESLNMNGRQVTVIIDGKASSMTQEQLYTLLKSIPSSRVESAEVMANAPARYRVKGQVINLTLRHGNGERVLQGEVYGGYMQEHDARFEERASLLYTDKHFEVDALYGHVHGDSFFYYDNQYRHSLNDGTQYALASKDTNRKRSHEHNARLGMNYNIAKNHSLSLSYTGMFDTSHRRQDVTGDISSRLKVDGTSQLHDAMLDYQTPFGMKAGAEYTHYKSPEEQQMAGTLFGNPVSYDTKGGQRIDKWKLYLSQEHSLGKGWGLNYGATYTTADDHSYQKYLSQENNGTQLPADNESEQTERQASIYAGTTKAFGDKLSLDLSLSAEYYHTPAWNEWNAFPNINITYMPSPRHILQLGVTSDRNYPTYWSVKDFTTYTNGGYGVIVGNPTLKPSSDYQATLSYTLNGKYLFRAWFEHEKDAIYQLPYQSSEKKELIYQYVNLDFQQQAGIMASVPVNVGTWLMNRLTLIGLWDRHKMSGFHDIPFDRNRIYGIAQLNTTAILSKQLMLNLNGMVHTKALQGPIDLPMAGNLDASLSYKFAKDKATLKLYCNDIFETKDERLHDTFKGQYIRNEIHTFRECGITLTYRFGGYKEKTRGQVDKSRFGRN